MRDTKIFFNATGIRQYIKKQKPSSVVIVSSQNIFKKQKWIFDVIHASGTKTKNIFVKDGEQAKSFAQLEYLLNQFSKLQLDKSALIIVVGGGTVGDLAGFAASIYLRGIDFANIPTTLLAQVDSAHGGKNGINFAGLKNQIGTIAMPKAIFIDRKFFKTLGKEQLIDGFGEILKYGFIQDKTILSLLNTDFSKIVQSSKMEKILKKSIACKYFYINKDPYEKSIRKILNVGHTFGHALELKYKISHGKAVIIGMLKEFDFCKIFGLSHGNLKQELIDILEKLYIEINPDSYVVDNKALLYDKKIKGDLIDFPVVIKRGTSQVKKINVHLMKKYQ